MTYYQFVQAVEGRIKEAVKESVAVRIHTAEKITVQSAED